MNQSQKWISVVGVNAAVVLYVLLMDLPLSGFLFFLALELPLYVLSLNAAALWEMFGRKNIKNYKVGIFTTLLSLFVVLALVIPMLLMFFFAEILLQWETVGISATTNITNFQFVVDFFLQNWVATIIFIYTTVAISIKQMVTHKANRYFLKRVLLVGVSPLIIVFLLFCTLIIFGLALEFTSLNSTSDTLIALSVSNDGIFIAKTAAILVLVLKIYLLEYK